MLLVVWLFLQFSKVIFTFVLLILIFEMRESLPIEDTDIKLIVDGQHNEVVTEHVGEL